MEAPESKTGRSGWSGRAALLLVLIFTVGVAHHRLDLTDTTRLHGLRELLASSGAPGLVVFVGALSLAVLLYFPGWPFIGLAVAVHGRLPGGVLAYAATVIAVCVSFAVVRTVGGTPLRSEAVPWVERLLARLESAPVRTIAVLRALTSMNAAVNYSLALSRVSFVQYLVGSALGLGFSISIQVHLLASLLGR